jgi:alpha 1,2-mannosyltransferase
MTDANVTTASSIKDNKTFFYYFCWISILCILALVILIVVFSRETTPATTITDKSWSNEEKTFKDLRFLPKSQQLLTIWTDTSSILPPEKILKGGVDTYKNIRLTFQNLPYAKTTPEIQQAYTFGTQGIVIVAGGFHYFSSAYVLIRELRHVGCILPIELWYKNGELSPEHIRHITQWGVVCLNIDHHISFEIKRKYSIKVLAMYLSSFQEILYLDADNNVIYDPTFLFSTEEYKQHETLFWPDFWPLNASAPCYLNFPEHIKPTVPTFQQDSGQIVINKKRYSQQLWCIFQILENDLETLFPTPFNIGDKDLFHTTWSATGQYFTFIPHRTAAIATVYVNKSQNKIQCIAQGQYAPDGTLLFVHQNNIEWTQKPYVNQEPWWILLKKHTHPTIGSVETGTWNPEGPTQTESFREVVGCMEDVYTGFLNELRNQEWYQDFYSDDLPNL